MDLPDFQQQCLQDIEIMHLLVQHGFHGQESAMLNQWHMSLWVIWLSEVCGGSGEKWLAQPG